MQFQELISSVSSQTVLGRDPKIAPSYSGEGSQVDRRPLGCGGTRTQQRGSSGGGKAQVVWRRKKKRKFLQRRRSDGQGARSHNRRGAGEGPNQTRSGGGAAGLPKRWQ